MTIPSDPSSGGTSGNWLFKNKEHVKASAAASLVKLREMKPGMLSQELKEALGMPEGAPPPWLINMQRYGPPPSYPQLKIHGLNAPILHGALFGYHARGWGKPPVDELGRPLYGDVFGQQPEQPKYEEESEDKTKHWGDLEEEEEEEEEEKEVEELDEEEMEDGIQSVDSLSMCIAAKGDESAECEKFAKYYRSLCPCEWLIAHLYLLQPQQVSKRMLCMLLV